MFGMKINMGNSKKKDNRIEGELYCKICKKHYTEDEYKKGVEENKLCSICDCKYSSAIEKYYFKVKK